MSLSRAQFKDFYSGTSLAFTSTISTGNIIVVGCSGSNGTTSDATCSDNLGNTYTKILQKKDVTTGETNAALFYAYNITGGTCTVSASAGGGDHGLVIVEYHSTNGSFTSDPLETSNFVTAAVGASSPITTSLTSTVQGMLFGFWGNEIGATPEVTGWTSNLSTVFINTNHYHASAEGLNKSPTTYTEGFTLTGVSNGHSVFLMAWFKEPGGVSGGVIKTINGLAYAIVKTINGIVVGSIKKINGQASQ